MADDEDIGDGHSITPFNSDQQVNAQLGCSSLTMSLTEATPEDAAPETIMEEALTSGPPPKQNQPPTILPTVELQQDDVLAKGKHGVQGDVFSPSILEECIPRVAGLNDIVDLIWRRVAYLAAQDGSYRGLQHQPKDMKYTQKIKNFIKKQEDFSLFEVLSKEMDLVFLRQLLEDILDSQESSLDDAEKGGISPDPALAALAVAPSCHRRGNADQLFAPIPYQW